MSYHYVLKLYLHSPEVNVHIFNSLIYMYKAVSEKFEAKHNDRNRRAAQKLYLHWLIFEHVHEKPNNVGL